MNSRVAKAANKSPAIPSTHGEQSAWRQLHYLNLYRITLAALFVSSFYIKTNLPLLGNMIPRLFESISLAYLFIAICASFIIHWRKFSFHAVIYSLTLVDILGLTLLMRASGGIETGLGMLLVVAVAGNSLLLGSKTSRLFAAIAAIAILAEQGLAYFDPALKANFTQAGILGIALFATAILAHVLSTRIRESEALAAQRGVDLANLAQLNQHVLQRMQSGIIVVDASQRIRLMNEPAWHMLGLSGLDSVTNQTLQLISPELAEQLFEWRRGQLAEPKIFKPGRGSAELLPSFTPLGSDAKAGSLIFLEDTTRMAQQAQQIKLASLGRLTASIAHEIRNPLGAISHAEQLLSESTAHDKADQRLLEIINTNTSRVNDIIENVLQLSRRDLAKPEHIELKPWLENFVHELSQTTGCALSDISVRIVPADCYVNMDATQLHQVLWNLCSNGLRYSPALSDRPRLNLHGGFDAATRRAFLEVIDHGPGIDAESREHIFEPFFTTENRGSGLGLYIARELCQSNQARLSYHTADTGGSCFRIEFSELQPMPEAFVHSR